MVLSPVMGGVVHYHLVDETEEALMEVVMVEMIWATSNMYESVHHTNKHTSTHTHACYYATLECEYIVLIT